MGCKEMVNVVLMMALVFLATPPLKTANAEEAKDHIVSVVLAAVIGWALKTLW